VPVERMLQGEREKLLRMEETIGKRVIGSAMRWWPCPRPVRRRACGLQDPNRPSGSFLFLGPTGRWQDRTDQGARWLPLRRRQRDGAHRHVGVHGEALRQPPDRRRPAGLCSGDDEGGVLDRGGRRRPYQVVLFDEVEKAHQDVFNVLLQVLDDGRLTDGQGRVVDFTNTLIVLTSNLGSQYLANLEEGRTFPASSRR